MGTLFGAMMGFLAFARHPERPWAGVVVSASGRGAAPTDPEVREAAARLVRYRLTVVARQRRWASPMFAVLAIGGIWFALTDSLWWWLATGTFVAALVLGLVQPRQMKRRLRKLDV